MAWLSSNGSRRVWGMGPPITNASVDASYPAAAMKYDYRGEYSTRKVIVVSFAIESYASFFRFGATPH